MTIMEDPAITMEAPMAADRAAAMVANRAADPTPLGISREFSIEYGLDLVFRWVWTVFGLGLSVSFD